MADDVLQLDVWAGDWGLPSVDPSCLGVLAYCKFSGVPVRLRKTNNPYKSPSGKLPVLRHEKKVMTKISDMFDYIKKQNWGTDLNLSTKDQADLKAFSSMIEETLHPAFVHTWWVDEKTYTGTTRPWFAKAIPFPYNFFIPGSLQRAATVYVYCSIENSSSTQEEFDAKIYKEAKECLNHLSYKLGEQEFFFGTEPTSLDALVFSYLGPLLKAPLPSNQLTNHIKGCENLCAFCNRILQRYLPLSTEELEKNRKKAEEENQNKKDALEFPHQKRDMILAAIFSAIGMISFALWSGLIEIVREDSEHSLDVGESNFDEYDETEEENFQES